jgi:hypothetical protein
LDTLPEPTDIGKLVEEPVPTNLRSFSKVHNSPNHFIFKFTNHVFPLPWPLPYKEAKNQQTKNINCRTAGPYGKKKIGKTIS